MDARLAFKLAFLVLGILLLVCVFTGCDRLVSRAVGEPFEREQDVSCQHGGFCFTCMPGFTGGMKCGVKFSPFCPGRQVARVRVFPIEDRFESGNMNRWERVERLTTLGTCR